MCRIVTLDAARSPPASRGRRRTDSIMGAALTDTPACRTAFLPQLAVLAAAAVDGRVDDRLVALGLAGDAGADSGQRFAALGRDRLAAIVAILGALARRR